MQGHGTATKRRSLGDPTSTLCSVLPTWPLCGSRANTRNWSLFWLATRTKRPPGEGEFARLGAFHRAPFDETQLAAGRVDGEGHQLVVVAAIEHAEEAAVGGQVQGAGADFALEAGRRQVVGLQLTQAAIALMGEHHHLAAQFQGQVGETPVGAEDQMARAAAGRGRDECRIGRLQRTFGLFRA